MYRPEFARKSAWSEGDAMSNLPEWVNKIACYLRRSREDLEAEKRGENTLMAQRELMVAEVLPRYHADVEVYEEVASGDTIRDRPVFQQLLTSLEQGVYQAIAVKDLTRLGRGSYSDMGRVYDLIRDKRIFIINSTSVLDPDNPDDLRNLRFSMFLSREEYESIVFRLVQGKYNQVRHRGHWVAGVTPYGYDYNRITRKLTPNQNADTVRLIYHLFLTDNLGPQAISRRLRQLCLPSPGGKAYWNPQTIRRILQNPVYKGTVSYKRTKRRKSDGKVVERPKEEQIFVDGAHPAIIQARLWTLTQERLNRAQPKTPLDFTPTELAGLVTCSSCGRKMIRQTSQQVYRRKDGAQSVYKKEFLACLQCGYWVQYRAIEDQLLRVLQSLNLPQIPLQKWTNLEESCSWATHHNEQLLATAYERRHLLLNRLAKARDCLVDGTFTREEYEADQTRYQQQLKEVDENIYALQTDLTAQNTQQALSGVYSSLLKLNTVYEAYRELSSSKRKNTLLRMLFERIELVFLGKQENRQNGFELDIYLSYIFPIEI